MWCLFKNEEMKLLYIYNTHYYGGHFVFMNSWYTSYTKSNNSTSKNYLSVYHLLINSYLLPISANIKDLINFYEYDYIFDSLISEILYL